MTSLQNNQIKRAAVVGVGYLGNFHAQKYKALSNLVNLVGVFDANLSQAQKIAGDLNIRCFESLGSMVGQVDLVTIAATTSAHFELAKFFLENKIHVNVEKPITANSHQGQALNALAKANNLKLAVGQSERFNPAVVELKKHLYSPSFIEMDRLAPYKARGADVSVVHDLMIHDLDLVLSMDASPCKVVSARGQKFMSPTLDVAACCLEFESGLSVHIKSSRIVPALIRTMRVIDKDSNGGSKQFLANLTTGELEVTTPGLVDQVKAPVSQKITTQKVDALLVETELFVRSVTEDKPCAVSGEDGTRALELVERIVDVIHSHHSS